MKLPLLSPTYPLLALRVLMGIIFITHGAARLYYWSIPDFGKFLEGWHLPFGTTLAMLITLGELAGGSLLVLGRWVRHAVLFHALIILTGIVLVHIRLGWFVVGLGGGGVEYSLLILAVLAVLYAHAAPQHR